MNGPVMKKTTLILTLAISLAALVAAVGGCATNRVALTDTGGLTLENKSESKVYVAWSDAYKENEGFVITGVLRRRDHVGPAIKAHVDIEIFSPAGQVIDVARSADIYVPKQTTGKFTAFKRFTVYFPNLPSTGASAVVTAHTSNHKPSI